MNEKTWLRILIPFSGNLKSAIQNLKWLGLSVIAFVLVVTGAVAARAAARKNPPHRVPGCKHCFW